MYYLNFTGIPYTGKFNGNGKTLSNFKIYAPDNSHVGLFGYVSTNGQIHNLRLKDFEVTGKALVGSLVGQCCYGTITNCSSNGIVTGENTVGGLIGYKRCSMFNCSSDGRVIGQTATGGLIGFDYFGVLFNSFSQAQTIGNQYTGGLIGQGRSIIYSCFATGAVTGNNYVGGLIGYKFSYQTDSNSFWDTQTSGLNIGVGSGTSDGIFGRTTEQMHMQSTFTDAGWDFENTWAICEGTNYPKLQWQKLPGDFICPDGVNLGDFAYLTQRWMDDNCELNDNCESADFNIDGTVDIHDLIIFTDYWLD